MFPHAIEAGGYHIAAVLESSGLEVIFNVVGELLQLSLEYLQFVLKVIELDLVLL